MSTYNATDLNSPFDTTTPAGSELAANLDDAIREVKLVAKNVISLAHSLEGKHIVAWCYSNQTAGTNVGTSGTGWNRRADMNAFTPHGTINGGSSPVTATGIYSGSFTIQTGTYLVYAYATGYKVDQTQLRVVRAVSNSPAASVVLIEGSPVYSGSAGNYSVCTSTAVGIITLVATSEIALEQYITTANATSGLCFGNGSSDNANPAAFILFKIA